ncbi:hypothetical protein [Ammoniphilus sp. 3BR4]|uniref:hypothetical protein n=1 Tax=Ammoniphilus sp. 3BR4 TaxID=3158265 RepID=UPI003465AA9D
MKRFGTWTIVITMVVITAIALSNLPKKIEEHNHEKRFQEQLAKEVDPPKAKEMIESEIAKGNLSEFGLIRIKICRQKFGKKDSQNENMSSWNKLPFY